MRELPSGTVTFLFTDIDGSTRWWDRHPAQMRGALARHDAMLREVIARCGGHVFKTVGDAFCAAFTTPADALDAARAAQRALLDEAWPAPIEIKVRMALHAGNADVREGDYFGPPLNRIARLLAAGHGGQVLLSRAAAELMGDALADGVSMRDMGVHALKDLSRPEHVYQLVDPALPAEFPPLRLPDTAAHTNVADAVEALIGRTGDIEAIRGALRASRLVTILGPGGIGKTRVALDVARAEAGGHPNGVWWVDLAAIAGPGRVAAQIAGAAGVQLGEGDPAAKLASALRTLDLLLVIDNCEHVIDEAARIVHGLLEHVPGVKVVATSQVAFKLPAERVYRLETLDVEDGVALLERRARSLDPRFAIDASNVEAARDVCEALEGVALAIEMAAARVPLMGLSAVRERLEDRFRMLGGSNRLSPGRHQTLLATLEWSHALLASDEMILLRRLGMFAGSFTTASAQALAQDASLDAWAVLDALGGLADKSFLQMESLDPPRYRLLETTRLYALARLDESGESVATRARHASVMADLSDAVRQDLFTLTDEDVDARYHFQYEDIRAAFEHAIAERMPGVAARTALALRLMDARRADASALRSRMEACFPLIPHATGLDAALLWWNVTASDQIAIDAVPRLSAARSRLAAWREQGEPWGLQMALCTYSDELARTADFEGAARTLDEAEALQRPDWPVRLPMTIAVHRGTVAMHAKDPASYRRHRREALRLAELCGATRTALAARLALGDAALMAEDYDEAATLSRDVAEQMHALNRPFTRGIALENLANALVHLRDLAGAADAAAQSLPIMRQNEAGADVFTIIALIAARGGWPEDAAQMLGHVDAWVASSQYDLAPNEARSADEASREVDVAIGADAHARLREAGRRLTDGEADALASRVFAAIGSG